MTPLACTPQWFTAVMGTAIVATATGALPFDAVILDVLGSIFWLAACALLVAATGHMVWRYATERGLFRRELLDPATAPFFGAVAMAPLAVGGATAAVGPQFLGDAAAIHLDQGLWAIGTVVAVAAATVVPALQFTSHRVEAAAASPAWLLPVVAPMVSAATAAVLVGSVESTGAARALAFTSLAMFGASGLAAALVTASLWWRLAHHQHADAATVPSMWIVLGPLGQSVTTVTMLALYAPSALGISPEALSAAAVVYGVPVMGFALLWLGISVIVAVLVAGRSLPFTMTWWSFTFPVGTCVTGAAGLAAVTGASVFGWLALGLFCLLLAGWCGSAWGTVRAVHYRRSLRSAAPVRSAATAGVR